jgi:hypothetical protein
MSFVEEGILHGGTSGRTFTRFLRNRRKRNYSPLVEQNYRGVSVYGGELRVRQRQSSYFSKRNTFKNHLMTPALMEPTVYLLLQVI